MPHIINLVSRYLTLGLLAAGPLTLAAQPTMIYDGSITPNGWDFSNVLMFSNSGKSWVYAPTNVSAYTVSGSYTTLNTSSSESIAAGFAVNPLAPLSLDTAAGYTISINLQTNSETHAGTNGENRAGFSLTLIGADVTKSIEIGFWGDQVWVQTGTANGETIFKHGESAAINTTDDFHRYNVVVQGDTYTIYNGQLFLLSGLLRDYSSSDAGFGGVPVYQTSNFFFMGDNTTSAGGSYNFTDVLFEVAAPHYQLMGDGDQLSMRNVTALPGAAYVTSSTLVKGTWEARNGGSVSGSGNTVENRAIRGYSLYADGAGSTISGVDLTVKAYGYQSSAVFADNGGAVTLSGGQVAVGYVDYGVPLPVGDNYNGGYAGLRAQRGGQITASNLTVTAEDSRSWLIAADNGGTVSGTNLTLSGGRISVAGGAVRLNGGSVTVSNCSLHINMPPFNLPASLFNVSGAGLVELQNVAVTGGGPSFATAGGPVLIGGSDNVSADGFKLFNVPSGTVNVSGGSLTVNGDDSRAVVTGGAAVVSWQNVGVQVTGNRAVAGELRGGALTVSGGTVSVSGSRVFVADTQYGGALTISDGAQITNSADKILLTATNRGAFDLILRNVELSGDVIADRGAAVTVYLQDHTRLSGALAPVDGAITLSGSDGSSFTGDLTGGGTSALTVSLDNSTLTGNVITSATATATITGGNGATVTGTLTGRDDSAIDLTVSGPGSSFAGDINQHDRAVVTVTIDHGATGSGGFAGGSLIVGGDGSWTFNKDATASLTDNRGVVYLGAHGNYLAIHSDTISGDGIWHFPVDSDTGAKSTVTGSTAADSQPRGIISVIGDGLRRDPNTVANTLVAGANKENWTWDNFHWGLEEYTQAGHDLDGNPHFAQHGISPAGVVLNSAIAVQQSMWFAQQNSLLKRMGELRYGARASRPPAGGTPALHNLIENIWLRSYGQQLNVGSKVAGKAYEQLIYGVDLGTDHKFTISADSDLYLGVYAGYGRSDLDYRTPGTDGESNTYYGGLYATWLHSSGFYLDATVKAASTDNDLKAPYGSTQLTASYSDVSIGGSIEIGNKFIFQDGWFVEPQFQVNYLHLLAEDYSAGPMTISAQDLDALQFRLGSLFGRTIKLTNSGILQPYLKISGVETISSGGVIRNGYQSVRANTDGARAELGGGIIWQLDADNQLHLDYEASFGDKYDKPWGLTVGYRHQF
ncbi:MAG: autotransporter outer membrane beta-barrel domain-containing protein [Verrucomicrobiales bacterium]|jgi:outer membrane autotransporter protein|nr:autotransporter outer membrane beta-barrel domain-containing protein [Verrucomicrobiales bacterium]